MKKIAIFASGSGSNAENIIQYFAQKPQFCVKSVFCNVPDAYVLERAKKYNVPTLVFNRSELRDPEKMLHQLQADGLKNTVFQLLFSTGKSSGIRTKYSASSRNRRSILSY